ncbi:T-cell surface glycoprotein CD8 alpha chain [Myxocyprinus asiaticus]|uniref:T-cell surface glycoprotein CD8 alpha chain n=1 Tax=Myxocyprinus asiaticus TaxID=70543 RepID=UPI0022236901|nr:T-cell surface glycoprotein CD8 alpha chain [Myxocyprinus asiaticus]
MHQLSIGFCVIFSLLHGSCARTFKEGEEVQVRCDLEAFGLMILWFRINDAGPEFLFTTKNKDIKVKVENENYKIVETSGKMHLVIQSFEKKRDSGAYSCAVFNNNRLTFGKLSNIKGEPDPATQPPKIAPTTKAKPEVVTTVKPKCTCKKSEIKPFLNCEIWILSSLSTGCGLLLILLIVTILYCNRLRTRRCPHHYKRQPQSRPADHAKLPNNHF